jgi:Leucine-rich repeat (LRR) protein
LNKVIEILHLSDNKITDIGAKYFLKNDTITELDLTNNNITNDSVIKALQNPNRSVIVDGISRTNKP